MRNREVVRTSSPPRKVVRREKRLRRRAPLSQDSFDSSDCAVEMTGGRCDSVDGFNQDPFR